MAKLNGLKLATILPITIVLAGGFIAWGEARVRLSYNIADVQELEAKHETDVNGLKGSLDEIDDKLTGVIIQQKVTEERVRAIQESQDRQEDTSKEILRELRKANGQ